MFQTGACSGRKRADRAERVQPEVEAQRRLTSPPSHRAGKIATVSLKAK